MSYDLHFCTKGHPAPPPAEILAWARQQVHFTVNVTSDRDFQCWYENEHTGVYFGMEHLREPAGDGAESIAPEHYADVQITFKMNYLRPSFFAYEAMPVVDEFAQRFSLLVIDPQDHEIGGDASPKQCRAEELTKAWLKSNQWAVNAIGEAAKQDE